MRRREDNLNGYARRLVQRNDTVREAVKHLARRAIVVCRMRWASRNIRVMGMLGGFMPMLVQNRMSVPRGVIGHHPWQRSQCRPEHGDERIQHHPFTPLRAWARSPSGLASVTRIVHGSAWADPRILGRGGA